MKTEKVHGSAILEVSSNLVKCFSNFLNVFGVLGPLVTTINGINQIIGILSLSIECAHNANDYPDIYADVFSYSEWIQENLEF